MILDKNSVGTINPKIYSNCVKDFNSYYVNQDLHRLEKYLNLEGFLEKTLKVKSALKSTGKSLKSLEKSFNSTVF